MYLSIIQSLKYIYLIFANDATKVYRSHSFKSSIKKRDRKLCEISKSIQAWDSKCHRGNFFQISCVNHFLKSTVYWTTRLNQQLNGIIWSYLSTWEQNHNVMVMGENVKEIYFCTLHSHYTSIIMTCLNSLQWMHNRLQHCINTKLDSITFLT